MTLQVRRPGPSVAEQDRMTRTEILQAVISAADRDPIVADQLRVHLAQVQRLMHGRGHPPGPWDPARWGLL
jgi:hypothetical protein